MQARVLAAVLMQLLGCARAPSELVVGAPEQAVAIAQLSAATPEDIAGLAEEDVLLALDRGWLDAAKVLLRLLRGRGDAVATLAVVRSRATKIRDDATEVINLMRAGANAEATDVNCAFQWAQRPEFIYLNVKFSSRIDGPVTVLNVDDERVTLGNDTMLFEATGRQKPKTFRLNLTFHGAILPEASTWSFASVGRMSFTIAKAVNETWPRLLQGKAKPKNMYSWYERQTALDAEVKAQTKAKKDAAQAERKAEENKEESPPAPPPPPSDGKPTAPPPADASLSPPSEPPKKKAKKKKKAATEGKDEV